MISLTARAALPALVGLALLSALSCGSGGEGGLRVLFYSDRDGDDDVYVAELDGGGIQQLTDAPGRDYEADITPDGRTLVVASEQESKSGQLFLMDADGSNVRRLTFSAEGGRQVTDDYPHWSPDGLSVVFQRTTATEERVDADVWLIDTATGEESQLTDAPEAWDSTPAFTADGSGVMFESNREGSFSIYRLDLATMEVARLTGDDESDNTGGKESPDGRSILFTSDRDGDPEVYLADAGGANVRQPAAQHPDHHRLHDGQREQRGDCRVDRIASREQHLCAGGRGQRMVGDDHAARAGGRLLLAVERGDEMPVGHGEWIR